MHYMTLLCVQGPEVWRCGRTIKVTSGELTVEGRYMVLVSQAFELVENFIIGIFLETKMVIYVKLCVMVLQIVLYLFITLSVTLTFQGHGSVNNFN